MGELAKADLGLETLAGTISPDSQQAKSILSKPSCLP
jgi:hypothetical protein